MLAFVEAFATLCDPHMIGGSNKKVIDMSCCRTLELHAC